MKLHPTLRLLALLILGHLALLGWNLNHRRHDGNLKVTFMDVGQGDAAVLETPSGKTILVDTGRTGSSEGNDAGRRIVAPFLNHEGIDHIDDLILTHPHADHIGGAASLIRLFAVDLLEDNGQATGSPEEATYLRAVHDRHVPYRVASEGQRIDCGDGVTLQVLAPDSAEIQGTPNDASVTLRVEYGHTSFLLMGDAEAGEEADLLKSGQPLGCDVLKAGHHGSDTSTTLEFLAAAHPHYAVISVGAHNLYGHPSARVISRLQESGAQVFRTDLNGAVTCISDGATVKVKPMYPNPY